MGIIKLKLIKQNGNPAALVSGITCSSSGHHQFLDKSYQTDRNGEAYIQAPEGQAVTIKLQGHVAVSGAVAGRSYEVWTRSEGLTGTRPA